MKNCIFHIPYKLDPIANSARMLRPRKLISALEEIGYNVNIVEGDIADRKNKINNIKILIQNGVIFDFMYSEASTQPTLLTSKNNLPLNPFFEFSFFKYIKNKGIKIGLYYPDVYWKFDDYAPHLPEYKRFLGRIMYKYDMYNYSKYLDTLYLQTSKMSKYIDNKKVLGKIKELPPGCEDNNTEEYEGKDKIKIFYVGGLGKVYRITELVKAVSEMKDVELTICCREKEWNLEKKHYLEYLKDNINIIHKSGNDLIPHFKSASLLSMLFASDIYREFVMPYKLFEYISYERPILSTKGTSVGDFVEKNSIGWQIENNKFEIIKLLKEISNDKNLISDKIKFLKIAKENNLWINRAEKIVEDLK